MEHYTGRLTLVPTQAGEPRVVEHPEDRAVGARLVQRQPALRDLRERAGPPSSGPGSSTCAAASRGAITPEGIGCWLVSPDGRFAACARPEGEGFIFTRSRAASRGRSPASGRAITCGSGATDGRYLYVSERYARPARIHRLDLETGERRLWRELAPANPAGMVGSIDPAITPDGATWAYSVLRYLNDLYVVEGLQ